MTISSKDILWTGKASDVKDFFFPSSGYSLEISKDIEPFEWDWFIWGLDAVDAWIRV